MPTEQITQTLAPTSAVDVQAAADRRDMADREAGARRCFAATSCCLTVGHRGPHTDAYGEEINTGYYPGVLFQAGGE